MLLDRSARAAWTATYRRFTREQVLRGGFAAAAGVFAGASMQPALGGGAPLGHSRRGSDQQNSVQVRLLAVNDFHGTLESSNVGARPAGGAAVLGSYLDALEAEAHSAGALSIRLSVGDVIGASPPISGLLLDEPAIMAMDLMGIRYSTVGNHEFDRGLGELRRLQFGGANEATGDFSGAQMRYLAANVIDQATGETIFPPYDVVDFGGVRVGFIGLVLESTPVIVRPAAVAGLSFLNETETVNRYAAELEAQGIRAIVVLHHQGGTGSTAGGSISGPVTPLIAAEDPEVDVVLSGHTHRPYWGTVAGKLVTQANAFGTHVAVVDLVLDKGTGDVIDKHAQIVTVFADAGPGLAPHPALSALVAQTAAIVEPVVKRPIAAVAMPITRNESSAGESALGNLIADSQRAAMGAEVAFMNAGGIRADLPGGSVTYGDAYTVQPFNNDLVRMDLTGTQIKRLLEQQWQGPATGILKTSGISYTWNRSAAPGDRVINNTLRAGEQQLDLTATYSVVVNSFLADGGDGFTVLREGANRIVGPVDLDAFVKYLPTLPAPVTARIEGRIRATG